MDECKKVGIFCRNVSYGKRAKEELDKGDGTQFIIFPINNRDKLLGQRIDKAYVLDSILVSICNLNPVPIIVLSLTLLLYTPLNLGSLPKS